jgi:hypothetical protein
MPTSVSYKITQVPDFDQEWDFLPNNGSMYCVPTSAMNWINYLAKHGFPSATSNPVNSPQENFKIIGNILAMGLYMKTDPVEGTSSDNAFEGLVDYLKDHFVPALVTTDSAPDSGSITVSDLEALALHKGLGMVGMGRYMRIPLELGGAFYRISGHEMSLVGLESGGPEADIEVSNPGDDTNLKTQSPFLRSPAHIKEEVHNLDGKWVVAPRWGTGISPYRFMDSWMAILPIFALTNPTAKVIVRYSSNFETGSTDTKEFPLPFEGDLVDLAIHPSLPSASIIVSGSNDIWTLDLARDSWSKTNAVASAQYLTYGGRDRRLFVVRGTEILSFDRTGKALDKLDAGTTIEAISYDQKNDRLVAAISGANQLLAVTPALQPLDHTHVPEVAGTGRLAISVNGSDATIVLSREGSQDAATLRWDSTGVRVQGYFRLMSEGQTSAAHVDRIGRLFAVDNDKIATFDTDGRRHAGSIFEGLPAGPLLKFARSSHNFDPVRSRRKEWKNATMPPFGIAIERNGAFGVVRRRRG